jgi:hypothetical protein
MAARLLRTLTVTVAGALCAGAVVALPVVISSSASPAAAAETCPSGSASPTPSTSPSSPPASANPLASVIGLISPTPTASSVSPSASPSATATATVSPSPCPSPSATSTATISPSATSTATVSPSAANCRVVTLRVTTKTINATGLASVTVTNAVPGTRVELQGYSQNHYGTASFANDTTNPDRAGTADDNGAVTFSDLRPGSNTRLRARNGACAYSASDVINVRTQLSLQVTRTAPRTYAFDVDSIPARPGGLIVSIYRITGSPCAAGVEPRNCPGETFVGQTRVSASSGAGRVRFTFDRTYPAREQFVLKTGQDAQNFPGRSNVRDLAVF